MAQRKTIINAFTILFLLSIIVLQTQSSFAQIILNDDQGTEFIVNQAPVYQQQTNQQNTQVTPTSSISAENIYIQTIKDVTATSCHFTSTIISITNNNNEPITTTISSNKEFVSFNKYSTFVMPGETNDIIMYVNAPCAKDFDTTQTLTFETQDIIHTIKQDISIIQVSNIAGRINNAYDSACPTQTVTYSATITNPAPFSDTYTITAKGKFAEDITILPQQFTLGPGESKDVSIFASLDKKEYGNKTFPFIIESENNKYESEFEVQAEIKQCYNFALAGPDTISVCENGFVKETNYTITNYAQFLNEFDLTLEDKPQFASLQGDYIALNENQSGIIPISLEPNSKSLFGFFEESIAQNYTATLSASSYVGDVIAQKDITIEVLSCYEHSLITEQESYEICSGDKSIPFSITNDGLFTENYVLELTSSDPNSVYITNNIVTVLANNFSTQELFINQHNLSDNSDITITATIQNNSKVSESVDIYFDRQSDKTCYDVKIVPRKVHIDTQENITEYIFPISIVNQGIRASNYTLYIDNSSDFIRLNETHVYLVSGEARELNLTAIKDNTTQENSPHFFITAETGAYVDTTKIKVYYDSTFPWWILLALLVLLILLLLVAIIIKKAKKSPKDKKAGRSKRVQKLTAAESAKKEKRAQRKTDEKKRRKSGFWWILLLILWLIAILFVIAFLLGNFGDDTNTTAGNETNQSSDNTTITLNETVQEQSNQTSVFAKIGNWFSGLFNQSSIPTNQSIDNNSIEIETNETIVDNVTANNSTQNTTTQTSFLDNLANWFNSLFEGSNNTNTSQSVNVSETNETQEQSNETIVEEQDTSLCPDVADMKAFVEENNLTNDFTYQVIPKNAIVEIDLSALFVDPDNDTLLYVLEDTKNITLTVINSTGYIVPDENFCGVRTTKIIAIDPDGANATSPEITLIIDEKASLSTYFNTFKGIVILATILIIAMIVATIIWIKE